LSALPQRPFVIALDGPAASGKSTVGMGVARELGFFYLDTGLLYRALTWAALDRGVDVADGEALGRLASEINLAVGPPTHGDGRQADVLADGRDISWDVRQPAVDTAVSRVAAHAPVRAALVEAQRAAVRPPGTVLAGRDIGSVIAPEALLKIWLAASAEERARRRAAQTGAGADVAATQARMVERDRLDGSRAIAPMARAADAVEVVTDGWPPDAVVAHVVQLARARMAGLGLNAV